MTKAKVVTLDLMKAEKIEEAFNKIIAEVESVGAEIINANVYITANGLKCLLTLFYKEAKA